MLKAILGRKHDFGTTAFYVAKSRKYYKFKLKLHRDMTYPYHWISKAGLFLT